MAGVFQNTEFLIFLATTKMGKCCIRLKKAEKISFKLIGELSSKITPKQWIEKYEKVLKR